MALRGDYQGGSQGGADRFGFGAAGGGEGLNAGIDKYMKWSWAFFVGAIVTCVAGITTFIYYLQNFTFAPATCFFEFFLLVFGFSLILLDLPMPGLQTHPHVLGFRTKVYKFALFMTRFLGRGIWYLFMATLVFGAMCDTGINFILGSVLTLYLLVLGLVAVGKGMVLTMKLNKVRDVLMSSGKTAENFVARGQAGLSSEQFKHMVGQMTNDQNMFGDDDVSYIINALSFAPYHADGLVKLEELQYWLQPGPPLMV